VIAFISIYFHPFPLFLLPTLFSSFGNQSLGSNHMLSIIFNFVLDFIFLLFHSLKKVKKKKKKVKNKTKREKKFEKND
jgi:large-conductance mechanosensitive channel